MSSITWKETLVSANVDSPTISNSSALSSLTDPAAIFSLQEYWMSRIGQRLSFCAAGTISNIATTPGTIRFHIYIRAASVFVTTGEIQLSTTAHTNVPFWLEMQAYCRLIGVTSSANTTWRGQNVAFSQAFAATAVADSVESHTMLMAPNVAGADVSPAINAAPVNTMPLYAKFSIANAGNSVLVNQFSVQADY